MSRIDAAKFQVIPFKNGGRDFKGADCWGGTMLLFAEYGIPLPDFHISCFATESISSEIKKHWGKSWVKLEEPEEPCLVVLATNPDYPGLANHLGVYVGDDKFMHTLIHQNMHLDSIDHIYWKNKILGYFRYVG